MLIAPSAIDALAALLIHGRPAVIVGLFSEHLTGDGREIFEHACKLGLEGIVSSASPRHTVPGKLKLG